MTRLALLFSRLFRASPLRHARFRTFYVGAIATALGYTTQATIAAWMMATLTSSTLMVALVQTASTAPTLLFGLLAGSLADIVDRRRVLFVAHIVLLLATVVLATVTLAGMMTPPVLLGLTFLVGLGFTFYMPAQQAAINDLVPRGDLASAVTLAAVAFNLARAVGPALAGAIAAWLSSGSALAMAAMFFLVMIIALRVLPTAAPAVPGFSETLLSGVGSGLRYARHSPPLRALIIRSLSFSLCASALWALLPVVARDQFASGASGFGLLLASFGGGAVVGGLWIPHHLRRFSLNAVVTSGVLLWAVALVLIAATSIIALALVGTFAAGAAWISVLASLSAGTQSSVPSWVRARAVSTNMVAVLGSLALGSAVWGWVASLTGTRVTLVISAACMVALVALNRVSRIAFGTEADVTTGVQLPDIPMVVEPLPEDGPVLIQIEYLIPHANREAFLSAIHAMERVRRRNGATSWRVFRDLEDQERFVERYIVRSWAEYVRLRARVTMADHELQQRLERMHKPDVPVRISRLIGFGPEQFEVAGTSPESRGRSPPNDSL